MSVTFSIFLLFPFPPFQSSSFQFFSFCFFPCGLHLLRWCHGGSADIWRQRLQLMLLADLRWGLVVSGSGSVSFSRNSLFLFFSSSSFFLFFFSPHHSDFFSPSFLSHFSSINPISSTHTDQVISGGKNRNGGLDGGLSMDNIKKRNHNDDLY